METEVVIYKSKSVHPILCNIYIITSIGIIGTVSWYFFLEHYSAMFKTMFLGGYFIYWFSLKNKDKISIDNEYITTHVADADDDNQDTTISISEVKKAKLESDLTLNFYDNTEIIMTFDLDNFTKDNIQSILNILSEKFPILLDNSLIEEGFSAPQHKMSEATPARRRVVKEKNTEKTPLKPIANEVSKNNESTKNRRKLEL